MFVGEAPGYHEDQKGRPFVGQAGKLLEELLASIGLTREQVFIANVLKSRPPNNRDPLPDEIAACKPYLWRQIEIIRPKVICTLGNHATKLLSGSPEGITRVHGRPQPFAIGGHEMSLYPIFHPAAALYTRAMLTTLQEDFRRLPGLLGRPLPAVAPPPAEASADVGAAPAAGPPTPESASPTAAPSAPAAPPESAPPLAAPSAPARPAPVPGRPAAAPAEAEQLGLF
jgi:DNA polymerase